MTTIRVTEHSVSIDRLAREFHGYRILQIADLHLGRRDPAAELLRTVAALPADLVVLTGDLIHDVRCVELLYRFLPDLVNAVHPPDGIFSVWGNHDKPVPEDRLQSPPIRWLNNDAVQIRRGAAAVNLVGVEQKNRGRTNLLRALQNAEPGWPTILLAHYPSTAYFLNGVFDLVISGHTHAGQVRLPGLPFMTNDDLSWRHARGLTRIGRAQLVVSAGLGYSGPCSVRLFAPPEVTLIRLISPAAAPA